MPYSLTFLIIIIIFVKIDGITEEYIYIGVAIAMA